MSTEAQRPTCPQVIIEAITVYGDARADSSMTSATKIGECISLVRDALAAASVGPSAYTAVTRERDGWREQAENLTKALRFSTSDVDLMRKHQAKDAWYWQGDGYDHIESMGNTMVVVIHAHDLRQLLKAQKRDQLAAVPAISDAEIDRIAELTEKAMPDGLRVFAKTCGWQQFSRLLVDNLRPYGLRRAASQPGLAEGDEREECVSWLSGLYPDSWPRQDAEHAWDHGHVFSLAWKERGRRASSVQPSWDAVPPLRIDEAKEAFPVKSDWMKELRWAYDLGVQRARAAQPQPTAGNWINADDVNHLVRELDVALNGEAGAARQASLCDLVAQVKSAPQPKGTVDRKSDVKAALAIAMAYATGEVPAWAGDPSTQDYASTQAPAPAPAALTEEALTDLIAENMTSVYHCTRVWEAWQTGTMSQDDFEPYADGNSPRELAAVILAAMAAVQAPAVVAQPQEAQNAAWRALADAGTVGSLIAFLATLDQAAPIVTAYHVTMGNGERRCKTRSLTISRERVDHATATIRASDTSLPYTHVLWAQPPEQVERDAMRYRWLRDVGDNGKTWNAFIHRGIGNNTPECIDEAIDAAMGASKPPVQESDRG